MKRLICATSFALVLPLGGCEKGDTRESPESSAAPVVIQPSNSVELVARLCSPLERTLLNSLASAHQVTVVSHPSPTLVVFSWNDPRSTDVVIGELHAEKDICMVEVNQTYHAMQPSAK